MPFPRSRKTFRRPKRSKRMPYRKPNVRNLVLSPILKRPYLFKRMGTRTVITNESSGTNALKVVTGDSGFIFGTPFTDNITNTQGVAFSHIFRLSQMPQASEFTSLFDKYKIAKIVYTVMFQHNQSGVTTQGVLPILHLTGDDDDATVPGGLSELQQRMGVKRYVMGATTVAKYSIYPKIAAEVYNSAVSTGYAVRRGYVSTANADVPHYAIKGIINNLYVTLNSTVAITIIPTYYLALREVK